MKKLKGQEISRCSILILCVLLFNCQKNGQLEQRKDIISNIKEKEHLSKENFFKCTTAKDTIFKNGDYIRFIPVNKSYGIEIKMNRTVDTLDNYSFDCDSYNGMIPKVLFKTDYIALGQGSSTNYRYLIICNLNNELGKIDVNKFETEIVENPEKEILFFKKNHNAFMLNKKKGKLFFTKLPSKFFNLKVQKFELYKNKVIIIFTQGDSLTYKLNEFDKLSNVTD